MSRRVYFITENCVLKLFKNILCHYGNCVSRLLPLNEIQDPVKSRRPALVFQNSQWLGNCHTTALLSYTIICHDDVIKWKHFPRYWPFVRGIHRWPVNSPHKGQWRGALMSSLICTRINGWVNNGEAGDLIRHRIHYDATEVPSLVIYLVILPSICFIHPLNLIRIGHTPQRLNYVDAFLIWSLYLTGIEHFYIFL